MTYGGLGYAPQHRQEANVLLVLCNTGTFHHGSHTLQASPNDDQATGTPMIYICSILGGPQGVSPGGGERINTHTQNDATQQPRR